MASVFAFQEILFLDGIANGGFQSSGEGDVIGCAEGRRRELSGVMGTVWMAAWGAAWSSSFTHGFRVVWSLILFPPI